MMGEMGVRGRRLLHTCSIAASLEGAVLSKAGEV